MLKKILFGLVVLVLIFILYVVTFFKSGLNTLRTNPNESSITIVTRSVDNGLVTENTEKCYGSRAELLLMAAKISGNQHENEILEIIKK